MLLRVYEGRLEIDLSTIEGKALAELVVQTAATYGQADSRLVERLRLAIRTDRQDCVELPVGAPNA